jgi:hypothetical protein
MSGARESVIPSRSESTKVHVVPPGLSLRILRARDHGIRIALPANYLHISLLGFQGRAAASSEHSAGRAPVRTQARYCQGST